MEPNNNEQQFPRQPGGSEPQAPQQPAEGGFHFGPQTGPTVPEYWAQPQPQFRTLVVPRTRIWPIVLGVLLSAVVTFTACCAIYSTKAAALLRSLADQGQSQTQDPSQPGQTIPVTDSKSPLEKKLSQIEQYLKIFFIGEMDEAALADAAAAGMIQGLEDEWSYYISADELASYQEALTNSYVGIGVTISAENVKTGLEIVDVTPDSPAYEAGLEIGELIVAVEGVPVLDGSQEALDITETKNRVRGAEGTAVTLTISHDGELRDVTIVRATIKVVNVTWELLEEDLAYIRIRNFEMNAARDTIQAIEAARDQGAKGLIFDVRFNPGGLKSEMVELLDYLLPEGPLFRSVDYTGAERVDRSDARCLEMPMAVLVNYDSYSAAEFFAAALQEYEAATVIGEQTYGKGRFQTDIVLDDGSAIHISVGQYTTPKGVSLVGKGITPDHVVELTEDQELDLYYSRLDREEDAQLQKAIEVLTN